MSIPDAAFQPIQLTLPSLTPSLVLQVLPYGLTLQSLYVQADGKTNDILIGPEDPHDHVSQKYTNTIVGRYCNRLPVPEDGQGLQVEKNGITATVTPRSNEKPTVSLHGGQTGWDSLVWTPLLDPSEVKLFTADELQTIDAEITPPSGLVFTRTSEDGEEGFPGRVRVEVLVALVPPKGNQIEKEQVNLGAVVLLYRAKLEEEGKVTPINLTQHWGFNLDASLQVGPPSIKDHKLTIAAENTVELDSTTALSTGRLLPVKGTHHAHAEKETGKIGELFPQNGYDEFYLFTRTPSYIPTRIPSSSLASSLTTTDQTQGVNIVKQILDLRPDPSTSPVTLESEKSGLKILFESNQSGVQFYTNNFASPSTNTRKRIHGGSTSTSELGDGYPAGSAAFLEFHEPLAGWMNPGTRGVSGDDTVLGQGEVYNNFVRVDVLYRTRQ
ncbi:galactose mutarotase-like protein [Irpex rosettiformis]|uniref:Galactose mutarotase-like protein n=1 Tax=Irpex rosettiformis TaxID=378272 RepID=A0ACB8U9K5_9APHY|nr:galactose mutarotase-like protein [Irpex rosettiformis]